MGCSLPGSSTHGILQARILEWAAIAFSSGGLHRVAKSWTQLSMRARHAATAAKSLQSCPTLRDPIDSSLPGSSTHGILQARVLEWGAIAFSYEGG